MMAGHLLFCDKSSNLC